MSWSRLVFLRRGKPIISHSLWAVGIEGGVADDSAHPTLKGRNYEPNQPCEIFCVRISSFSTSPSHRKLPSLPKENYLGSDTLLSHQPSIDASPEAAMNAITRALKKGEIPHSIPKNLSTMRLTVVTPQGTLQRQLPHHHQRLVNVVV